MGFVCKCRLICNSWKRSLYANSLVAYKVITWNCSQLFQNVFRGRSLLLFDMDFSVILCCSVLCIFHRNIRLKILPPIQSLNTFPAGKDNHVNSLLSFSYYQIHQTASFFLFNDIVQGSSVSLIMLGSLPMFMNKGERHTIKPKPHVNFWHDLKSTGAVTFVWISPCNYRKGVFSLFRAFLIQPSEAREQGWECKARFTKRLEPRIYTLNLKVTYLKLFSRSLHQKRLKFTAI